MWDQCYSSKGDINQFKIFNGKYSELSDEIYQAHLEYVQKLRLIVENNEEIFDDTSKWVQIWSEYIEFETTYSDPLRFRQSWYRPLVETNKRKNLTNKLANLKKKIAAQAKQVDDMEKKHHGLNCLKYIEEYEAEHKELQNEIKNIRLTKNKFVANKPVFGKSPSSNANIGDSSKATNIKASKCLAANKLATSASCSKLAIASAKKIQTPLSNNKYSKNFLPGHSHYGKMSAKKGASSSNGKSSDCLTLNAQKTPFTCQKNKPKFSRKVIYFLTYFLILILIF